MTIRPILIAALALSATPAFADDAATCGTVRLSDPGWTDITATNGLASVMLDALGYTPDVQTLSVPIGYEALKGGQIDAFLGNWMPAQKSFRDDLDASGRTTELVQNLDGARFTLGVNKAGADLGVKDFADLDAHRDAFDGRIYGIEAGNDGNVIIDNMIKADAFGLKDFRLVESSEAGMLSQIKRAQRSKDWAVFLGWEPHPMNKSIDMTYLTGGDEWFGPDLGGATVYTNVPAGYRQSCPNVGKFLDNLVFDLNMENEIMRSIIDDKQAPEAAATAWLKSNPAVLETWLKGVATVDGKDGLAAVRKHLGVS